MYGARRLLGIKEWLFESVGVQDIKKKVREERSRIESDHCVVLD